MASRIMIHQKLVSSLRRTTLLHRQQQQLRFKSSVRPEQKSFFDSTSDFWANLRRQAATALTSTLSPEEQHEMLKKLGTALPFQETDKAATAAEKPAQNDEEDESSSLNVQKTIEEAVAEARLQEAASQDKKWQQEKERILAEAEKAARQRVEAELRVQKFQQWQQAVNQAKQEQDAQVVSEAAASLNEEEKEHPLLGKAVVDLGYKRVHLVSAKDLATIQVWKKQRIYRHNRAQIMAQDKIKTLHLGMPGVISLHEVRQAIKALSSSFC